MREPKTALTYIYIPATVNNLESWLKRKSLEGLRLSKKTHWKFHFESCSPHEREYFVYSDFDRSRGISHDFYAARQKYKLTASSLNKISLTVFEADPRKIDNEYYRVKRLRNSYYFKHYLKLFIFSLIFFTLSALVAVKTPIFLFGTLVFLLPLIYALVSVLILKKTPR